MAKLDLVIVGSVALDSLKSPFGERERILGGSTTFASVAASVFCKPGIVGVIGDDFPAEHELFLQQRGVDLGGLQRRTGKTFHWRGRYEAEDMNTAITEDTQLGVFADFSPVIPDTYRETDYLFLGNIHPKLQLDVLDQMKPDVFSAADTMNFWIDGTPDLLRKVIARVNLMLLNDAEVREISGKTNLMDAAEEIRKMGPDVVVVKKGEHGALIVSNYGISLLPAFPLVTAQDPTGAGDTFAGGMMGHLARYGAESREALAGAALMGTVLASFTVESFGVTKLAMAGSDTINERVTMLTEAMKIDLHLLE